MPSTFNDFTHLLRLICFSNFSVLKFKKLNLSNIFSPPPNPPHPRSPIQNLDETLFFKVFIFAVFSFVELSLLRIWNDTQF